jgi:large subunit ribosomal protein L22
MEAKASARYLPISFRKIKRVLDTVRGESVEDALDVLRLNRTRPARMIEKVVNAASAAAMDQHDIDAEDLHICRAWVDVGPMRKWRMPRARGSWTPIIHRTCHLQIYVSDEAAAEPEPVEASEQETEEAEGGKE